MKKILTLTMLFLTFALHAGVYNADNLPVDRNHITYSRVINPDNILNNQAVSAIDTLLLELQRSTGVQALVIAITNIEDDDPFQFTLDVFNKYGVGSKDNTGFALTLATGDRSYWLLTGEGLEGTLPDAICKRIENRVMVPLLKNEDWDNAMLSTIATIKEYVEGDEEIREAYSKDEGEDPLSWFVILSVLFGPAIAIAAIVKYTNYKRRHCKICGKHHMKKVSVETQQLNQFITQYNELWVCPDCGNSEHRISNVDLSNQSGGTIIGGGGGHRGGGFGGGSFGGFGGGHSMGGGAGGRF